MRMIRFFLLYYLVNYLLTFSALGEELIRNGNFSQISPISDSLIGWRSSVNTIRNISKTSKGICLHGKFQLFQLIDISAELAENFILTLSGKIESGYCEVTIQAFQPGVIKRMSYPIIFSKRYTPSQELQKIKINFRIPNKKFTSHLKINFSSNCCDSMVTLTHVSLIPEINKSKHFNNIFLSWADKKIICSGIYVSRKDFYGKMGAKILQKYLYKMTGYILSINFLSKQEKKNLKGKILIGKACIDSGFISKGEMQKIGEGGFLVKNKNLCLGIIGKDAPGLIAGAYEFLKTIGVKFLSFEEIEYPCFTSKALILKGVIFKRTPAFSFRFNGRIFNPNFLPISFIASPYRIGENCSEIHTQSFLVNFDKYHNEHPEYFALQENGKRLSFKPQNRLTFVHLCISNSDVRKLTSENILKWIELDPHAKYFFIGQGDNYRYRCRCKKCNDKKTGNYTDKMLSFVNEVTAEARKKYPDKIFFIILYEGTDALPLYVKPADNVCLMYCTFRPKWWCHSHAFCKFNKKGIKELIKWANTYPGKLYIFDYPAGAKEALSIFASFYAIADKIRFYSALGIKGVEFCGTPKQFNALFTHVISRLLWDPGIDVEQAIDNFMRLYYGDAAPFMRDYFDLIYQEVNNRQFHQNCELFNFGLTSDYFKRKSYELFALAEHSVQSQPKFLKRVKREKLFLLYNDLNEYSPYTHISFNALHDFAIKLAEFAEIAKEEEIYYVDRRHSDLSSWFWEKAGLKLTIPWIRDAKIDKLIKFPLKTLSTEKNYFQIKTTKGWKIPALAFKGGEFDKDKTFVIIRRNIFLSSLISADLYLEEKPAEDMVMEIIGREEKGCIIEILVNGKKVFLKNANKMFYSYIGEYNWKKWGKTHIVISKNLFKKGKNEIQIKNLTPESPVYEKNKLNALCPYKPNPYAGWIIVKEFYLYPIKKNK